jgi:hypothetical protein
VTEPRGSASTGGTRDNAGGALDRGLDPGRGTRAGGLTRRTPLLGPSESRLGSGCTAAGATPLHVVVRAVMIPRSREVRCKPGSAPRGRSCVQCHQRFLPGATAGTQKRRADARAGWESDPAAVAGRIDMARPELVYKAS